MIYLDNASTSWPKAPGVAEEMTRFLEHDAANPGRGAHRMAVAAQKVMLDTRLKLVRLFNAEEPERIIYTFNTTDGLNAAIIGSVIAAEKRAGNGGPDHLPHVVATVLDHNAIIRPLNTLEQAGRIRVTWVSCDENCIINPQDVADQVTEETVLVAFTHASNVTGTIQPAADIVKAVRAKNPRALTVLDAAQTAGVVPIDVQEMKLDLLAVPGHKGLLGPTGTGALYVSKRAYQPGSDESLVTNYRAGGTGGDSALPLQPEDLPFHFEAGTPNTVGVAGLGVSVEYVLERGPQNILEHEHRMLEPFFDRFGGSDGPVRIYGSPDLNHHMGTTSFTIEGYCPLDAAGVLDTTFEIATRSGLHCSPKAHRLIGTYPDGTVRLSPGPFTTLAEMETACDAVAQIAGMK